MSLYDKEMLNELIIESREHLASVEPDLLELEQHDLALRLPTERTGAMVEFVEAHTTPPVLEFHVQEYRYCEMVAPSSESLRSPLILPMYPAHLSVSWEPFRKTRVILPPSVVMFPGVTLDSHL